MWAAKAAKVEYKLLPKLCRGGRDQETWLTNSRIMNRTLLMMNGHFRPYLSAAIPKMIDPTAEDGKAGLLVEESLETNSIRAETYTETSAPE